MTQRDNQYKIRDAADMAVNLPPLDRHPGTFIRDVLLPEYGLRVAPAAAALGINRQGLINVLDGKSDVSRDLAYKFGALMRDEVADLLIAYQHAYDLAREREKREAYKMTIRRVEPVSAE